MELSGNTQGLKPSERRMLERIGRRRVDPSLVVSQELASFMCECSRDIFRQIGVFIDRRGEVTHVIIGDAHRLLLPDVGRGRGGLGRLRGLRLVHTHLRAEPLTRDDLVDLAKLRLDLVAVIGMRPDGEAGELRAAHLLPENPAGELWHELPILPMTQQALASFDFMRLVRSLEEELGARATATRTVEGADRGVLLEVTIGRGHDSESRVAEMRELCRTAGVEVVDVAMQRRPTPDPKFLLGKGKLEEIVMRALQCDANLLIFGTELSPAQARSIADLTELKVIDRTMLILDIFAQHATTRDGKLQVELAQLRYALPRLVEKNTMMSRLTGGIGGRGPGETKLEINRRRAREKIKQYEREILEVSRRRTQRRSLRTQRRMPVVAIVGYTNAGKSTLLNALTVRDANGVPHGGRPVLVADKLFATLEPASRRLRFPHEREIIITDTVGFIRDLPRDLVKAFRATLEELDEADLLIHVVDSADPAHENQIHAVEHILRDLKLDEKRRILVLNKMDRLGPGEAERLQRQHQGIVLSSLQSNTLAPLLDEISRLLWEEDKLIGDDLHSD